MHDKKIRTCIVISNIQSNQYKSICELYSNLNKGYFIKVISDSSSLFEEFEFQAETTGSNQSIRKRMLKSFHLFWRIQSEIY